MHAQETGNGFAAATTGPAYDAARTALVGRLGRGRSSTRAGGGSIPLVSTLQAAVPDAEVLLVGATDSYSNIHAPDERVLLDELEKATCGRGRVLRRVRRALGLAVTDRSSRRTARSRPRGWSACSTASRRVGNKMPDPAILFLWLCVWA